MKKILSLTLGSTIVLGMMLLSVYFIQGTSAQSEVAPEIDPEIQKILDEEARLMEGGLSDGAASPPSEETPVSQLPAPELVAPAEEPTGDSISAEGSENLSVNVDTEVSASGLRLDVPLNYVPEDFRDPFATPNTVEPGGAAVTGSEATPDMLLDGEIGDPLQAYFLKDYRVIGVLWGVKKPRAMVQIPGGRVISVTPGMRLGREGAVAWTIREKEVVFLMPDVSGDLKAGTPFVLQMRN